MLNNYKKIIIITFSEININIDSATTYAEVSSITLRKPVAHVNHIKDLEKNKNSWELALLHCLTQASDRSHHDCHMLVSNNDQLSSKTQSANKEAKKGIVVSPANIIHFCRNQLVFQ